MEVFARDPVVSAQETLGLTPEVLDLVDLRVGSHLPSRPVNATGAEACDVQCRPAGVKIRIDDGIHPRLSSRRRWRRIGSLGRHGDRNNLAVMDGQSENRRLDCAPARTLAAVRARSSAADGNDFERVRVRAFQALRNDFAQAVVEESRGIPIDADERGRGSRRRAGHKVLQQPLALLVGQTGPA